jgi:hypothetical protein
MERKLTILAFAVLAASANAQNYQQRVLASNPLAYWTFEANNATSLVGGFTLLQSGNTVVSNAGDGAPLGDVAGNRSLLFDGTGNAQTNLGSEFQGQDHGTIMFWLNFQTDPQGQIYNGLVYSKAGTYSLLARLGQPFTANITNSMSYADHLYGPAIASGEWHHYVFSFDRTAADPNAKRTIYIDGQLAAADGSNNGYDPGGFLQMGGALGYTTSNLVGSIDEFAVWNRTLSASEIQATYNPVPEPISLAVLGIGVMAVIRRRKR